MAGSGTAPLRTDQDVLLSVQHLEVEFPVGGERVYAVSDVSFDVLVGETIGLVGESGSGKSTAGLAVMQLLSGYQGSVELGGQVLGSLSSAELRSTRPRFQMIFQDPVSALNPRRRVRDIVAEQLDIWPQESGPSRAERVAEVLTAVGLDVDQVGDRRPSQLSGGQAQRVSIARALMLDPDLLVCDEPVSALDVSIQAQIVNLLEDLKKRYHLAVVFIAHDLAVVKNVSDRVAVMYLGKLCEIGNADDIYAHPAHPYTQALLDSAPSMELTVAAPPLGGEIPSPTDPPTGCRFRTRCPRASAICSEQEPVMTPTASDHFVACHHPLERADESLT
jgi:peptide/nickel transport system ATP-binding protein